MIRMPLILTEKNSRTLIHDNDCISHQIVAPLPQCIHLLTIKMSLKFPFLRKRGLY